VGGGPAEIQEAYSWGSHASKLTREIRDPRVPEHKDLHLTAEELDRIMTWVDMNGVYYPTYASAYPESLTGRIPLSNAQLTQLSQLTGVPFASQRSFNANQESEITFDRPELSPCLSRLDPKDSRYQEALTILQAGKAMLASRPRGDELAGFVPCEADQHREAKYAQRREIEAHNREAIRDGRTEYDP
jgi:hypothetical protein